MSRSALRCESCGAIWLSESAQELVERSERCLRCAGRLVNADEQVSTPESERPTLAVTGADSVLGERVAARLARLGVAQRLVVQPPARAPRLAGAEVAEAPYDDAAAMRGALAEVNALFLVADDDSANMVQHQIAVVDAAAEAGVERIVYVSILAAAESATGSSARDHFRVEQHTRATGVPSTFLRPSLHLDMLASLASADGVIWNAAEEGRVACVSRDDIAEVAAVVLTAQDHDGRTYEVTGSESQTMKEITHQLALATGRPITCMPQTLEEARAFRAGNDGSDWEIECWVSTFAAIAAGEMDVVSDTVVTLTGHDPQTFAAYLDQRPECYAHLVRADSP